MRPYANGGGAPWAKFGQQYANQLRRRRSKTGAKWHLDEVFLKINGKTSSLWRAVDQDGTVRADFQVWNEVITLQMAA